MKLIRTVDAAGQVLCHDITQIIRANTRMPASARGTSSSLGYPCAAPSAKENLYVWEKHPGILSRGRGRRPVAQGRCGQNIHGTAPKEGKIELIADCDGLLKINRKALMMAVNSTPCR